MRRTSIARPSTKPSLQPCLRFACGRSAAGRNCAPHRLDCSEAVLREDRGALDASAQHSVGPAASRFLSVASKSAFDPAATEVQRCREMAPIVGTGEQADISRWNKQREQESGTSSFAQILAGPAKMLY